MNKNPDFPNNDDLFTNPNKRSVEEEYPDLIWVKAYEQANGRIVFIGSKNHSDRDKLYHSDTEVRVLRRVVDELREELRLLKEDFLL